MTETVTQALESLRAAVRREALSAVESVLNGEAPARRRTGRPPKAKVKKPLSPAQRRALKKMWAARRKQARAARAKR